MRLPRSRVDRLTVALTLALGFCLLLLSGLGTAVISQARGLDGNPTERSADAAKLQALAAGAGLLATVVLVLITWLYVAFTRGVLEATREAARSTADQATATRSELEAVREQSKALLDQVDAIRDQTRAVVDQVGIATAALRHSELVFEESVKARLDTAAPLMSVMVASSRLEIPGDGNPGTVPVEQFDGTTYSLVVVVRVLRHGAIAGIIRTLPPRFGQWDALDPILHSDGVTAGPTHDIAWRWQRTGRELRQIPGMPPLELAVESLDGSVIDTFTWHGAFEPPPVVGNVVRGNDSVVRGPKIADRSRSYPGLA